MDDEFFLKRIKDIIRLSEKYHTARFSNYLDSGQQAVLKKNMPYAELFGGFEDAERKMFGVFPEWLDESDKIYPISVIKFTHKYEKELSHRHFLGTILSLGIERNKIGDILVGENETFVFVCSDIAEFLKNSITKIAGCGVKCEIVGIKDVSIPERKFEIISSICASLRLDAVLSGLTGRSREECKKKILSGQVQINHFDVIKTDNNVKEGDLLSVKGFGRAVLAEVGSKTRSDKIHITFKKYI